MPCAYRAALVVELVDTADSKSAEEIRAGSIPARGTITAQQNLSSTQQNPHVFQAVRVFCCALPQLGSQSTASRL